MNLQLILHKILQIGYIYSIFFLEIVETIITSYIYNNYYFKITILNQLLLRKLFSTHFCQLQL